MEITNSRDYNQEKTMSIISKGDVKIGRVKVDVLGVFSSETASPVLLEKVLQTLHERTRSGKSLVTQKCRLQFWYLKETRGYVLILKSVANKTVLEAFNLNAVQIPQVGQFTMDKGSTMKLVFLSVLNNAGQWDLFVIHPIIMTAEDLVIKMTKLIQQVNNKNTDSTTEPNHYMINDGASTSTTPSHSMKPNDHRDILESDGNHSIYSLSSTFINTWTGKIDQMLNMSTAYSLEGSFNSHSDLYMLNKNLKEIRKFMNDLFLVMKEIIEKSKLINGTEPVNNPPLPEKSKFFHIISIIRQSLNICGEHHLVIYNPEASEIVNLQFIFLRILGDATLNHQNGRPELVASQDQPPIEVNTVKFLSENLSQENKYYWSLLGPNYGFMKSAVSPMHDINEIDEFRIRREMINDEPRKPNYTPTPLPEFPEFSYRNKSYDDLEMMTQRTQPVTHQRPWTHNPRISNADNGIIHRISPPTPPSPENNRLEDQSYEYQNHERRNHEHQSHERRNHEHQSHERRNHEHQKVAPYLTTQFRIYPASAPHSPNIIPRPLPVNCNIHSTHSSWNDRQCRFIDSVLLRNGKLAKSAQDRPATNEQELAISKNEVVEIIENHQYYSDQYQLTIKNMYGDIGLCPRSALQNMS